MPRSRLDPLQQAVLEALATGVAGWTLTGGGALAGFHLGHRTTRDLDLFWHGRSELGSAGDEVLRALRDGGLEVHVLQSSPAFLRVQVERGEARTVVDLVAEPVLPLDPPNRFEVGQSAIAVDSAQEILVNKLCALLHRSELRDLGDALALVESGCDLQRALSDAPRKEAGFSPLTLMWVVKNLPVEKLARSAGTTPAEAADMLRKRDAILEEIARLTGRDL